MCAGVGWGGGRGSLALQAGLSRIVGVDPCLQFPQVGFVDDQLIVLDLVLLGGKGDLEPLEAGSHRIHSKEGEARFPTEAYDGGRIPGGVPDLRHHEAGDLSLEESRDLETDAPARDLDVLEESVFGRSGQEGPHDRAVVLVGTLLEQNIQLVRSRERDACERARRPPIQ